MQPKRKSHCNLRLGCMHNHGVVIKTRAPPPRRHVGHAQIQLLLRNLHVRTRLALPHSLASEYGPESVAAVQSRRARASDVRVTATQLPFELAAFGAAPAVVVHDGVGDLARGRKAGVRIAGRAQDGRDETEREQPATDEKRRRLHCCYIARRYVVLLSLGGSPFNCISTCRRIIIQFVNPNILGTSIEL